MNGVRPNPYPVVLAALLCLLPLTLCVAAGTGAYAIRPFRIPAILWGHLDDEGYRVLLYVRLPRVALAAMVGAVLAVSGASLQTLFRNPLADPGLIGVSSGAALAACGWMVLVGGGSALGLWGLPVAAFAGGLLVAWLVWRLARTAGPANTATLLLTGVALNALAGAGIGLLFYISDDKQLREMTFWQMGSLSGATWPVTLSALPPALAGMLLLLPTGRRLNALALGESEAFHLGIRVRHLQRRVVLGAALAVSGAIAAAGGIGFIGLVVPHLLRLSFGADNRHLLPCAALLGAIVLVAADTAARTCVQPAEMPVGVVTSLVGGPYFLWLLLRQKRSACHA